MKKKLILLVVLLLGNYISSFAQIIKPVTWSFSQMPVGNNEVELVLKAAIQSGWHIYSTKLPEGGPVQTTVSFIPDTLRYQLIGEITTSSLAIKEHDQLFNMDLEFFSHEAVFVQKIKLLTPETFDLNGAIAYQSCNNETCTLDEHDFSFKINGSKDTLFTLNTGIIQKDQGNTHHGLWWFLMFSFIAGLAAILTPCVFPMIPMTVSFFLNSNKSRLNARIQALAYGGSIILIYTLIGTLVALTLGADFANWISTHWIPNVLFFIVFEIGRAHV